MKNWTEITGGANLPDLVMKVRLEEVTEQLATLQKHIDKAASIQVVNWGGVETLAYTIDQLEQLNEFLASGPTE